MPRHRSRFDAELWEAVTSAAEARADELSPLDDEALAALVRDAFQDGIARASQVAVDSMVAQMASLTTTIRTQRAGFEELLLAHWAPALDSLDGLIHAAIEAGGQYVTDERRAAGWTAVDDAVTRLHARACLIASEARALLHAGFASGAYARWRTLHELAVTAFFISEAGLDEPGQRLAERYLAWAAVGEDRRLRTMVAVAHRLGERPPTSQELAASKRVVDDLKARFGRMFAKDYGWAAAQLNLQRVTFVDLEKAVNMDHVRPYFQDASAPVHSGPDALYRDLGADASRGHVMLAGASDTGLGDPGQSVALALAQVTTALLTLRPTPDRALMLQAILGFAEHVRDAFLACDQEMEAKVRRNWGRIARQRAFARRGAAAKRPGSRIVAIRRRRAT